MYVSMTLPRSGKCNTKVGPIPVSTSSSAWCPSTCPHNNGNGGGCYASAGPLAIHWRKVTAGERGVPWDAFCEQVKQLAKGQLWRHNQAGDLPTEEDGVTISRAHVEALVAANKGRRGFTYTHHQPTPANLETIKRANIGGLTVSLSADGLAMADAYAKLEVGPVVVVAEEGQSRTPQGRKVLLCPAYSRPGVTCATCALCARTDRPIIAFKPHGAQANKVRATLARLT